MERAAKKARSLEKMEHFSRDPSLPSLPQLIFKIREITDDPRSGVADLANVILSDHQLTTRILQLANSAYYGEYAGKVTRVTQAVALIGFHSVRNAAMALAIYSAIEKLGKCPKFDFAVFWSRSVGAAVIGKQLALNIGSKASEEAFIAGFLHDIGQPLLATIFPSEYDTILADKLSHDDLTNSELSSLGLDHLEAGGWLARKWRLPQTLVAPIEQHDRRSFQSTQRAHDSLIDIVYLADRLHPFVMTNMPQAPELLEQVKSEAKTLLGVRPETIDALIEDGRALIVEIAAELNVQIKEACEYGPYDKSAAELSARLATRELQLAIIQSASDSLAHAQTEDAALEIALDAAFRGLELDNCLLFAVSSDGGTLTYARGYGPLARATYDDVTVDFQSSGSHFHPSARLGRPHAGVAGGVNICGAKPYETGDSGPVLVGVEHFVTVPVMVTDTCHYIIFATPQNDSEPLDEQRMRTLTVLANQAGTAVERVTLRRQLAAAQGAMRPSAPASYPG